MRFKKLLIENYKSFQKPTEIIFPHTEPGKTIFLIGGMNGAGKTSIMEAINICLYGIKERELFPLINRKERAKGNFSVAFELVIETDEFEEMVVHRSWDTGSKREPNYRDLEEKLLIKKDGKEVSIQNKQMWQDYINRTIPYSVTQFFFFDGEKIQEIASDEHSEIRLKSSLESVLGIGYIRKLSEDILHIRNDERKNFVEISDEDIELRENELAILRREKKKMEAKHDEIKNEIKDFSDKLSNLKEKFKISFGFEPERNKERKIKERQRIKDSTRLARIEEQIKPLFEKYIPYALAGKLFPGLKKQIELERVSTKKEILKESAIPLANKIIKTLDEPPPIFSSKLSTEQKNEIRERIIKALGVDKSKDDKVKKILNLSDKDASKIELIIENIENSEVSILCNLLEEKKELEKKISESEDNIGTSIYGEAEKKLFEELQNGIEGYTSQIARKQEEIRSLEEKILDLDEKIRTKEKELSKLYEKHEISQKKSLFLKECEKLAKLFDSYIVRLRKRKLKHLKKYTFDMYRKLASKGDLINDIKINEETYQITIEDKNGHVVRKSGLSAGEKEVFAISLLWGLSQVSDVKLPIVIDTPLSRLDSSHRDAIINNYFPNAGEQVIILSTDTEVDQNYYFKLEAYLAGAIRLNFEKARELTTIERGYFWR